MKEKFMPVKKMLDYEGNIYELTNAVIQRANQVTKTKSADLAQYHDKPVSLAMDEILEGKVSFRNKSR